MNKIKKWEIWGAVLTIIIGSLLHFTYDWSGGNKAVALLAAVNESTWEHLKLAFWPTFIFAVIEWFVWGKTTKNFCLATAAKLFSMPIIIVALFYGWLAIFPDNFFWDISIFIVAVILGYIFSYKILKLEKDYNLKTLSLILIVIGLAKFALFTYFPPHIFLFHDPVSGGYGIINKTESTVPAEPATVDGMKKYDGGSYSFLYPASINGLNMKRQTWQDLPLAEYVGIYNDPQRFSFAIYEFGFKIDNEMFHNSQNEKKIDPNMSLAQFKTLSNSLGDVLAIKKLSDRSLLVFSYTNYECSPDAQIMIMAPVQNSALFSNINVNVQPDELTNLPADETGDQCSINLVAFQNLINNILAGTASQDVMDALAMGQKIAESASGK